MIDPKRLKVVQINLHHCEAASTELATHLIDNNVDVALIQEPWINKNRVVGLKVTGYTLFVPHTDDKVRTCILARTEFKFMISYSFSNGDLTVVTGEARDRTVLALASVYLPYEATDPPGDKVRELVEHSGRSGSRLVLGCDANAHHTQWGSADINKRGESMFDFIIASNLFICNRGNTPTFRTRDREAVIDITLTNCRELVEDWRVALDFSFSDHSRLSFSLMFERSKGCPYRNPRRTDWDSFSGLVQRNLRVTRNWGSNPAGVEQLVDTFTGVLTSSYERSCPLNFPGRRTQPRWWTDELRTQRSTVRKLFNRAKYTRREEDWSNFRVSYGKYKGDIRRAKRDSWIKFSESVESVNEMSRFRRILSKDPVVPGFIQRPDGSWTESGSESLCLLMETHFPGCVDPGSGEQAVCGDPFSGSGSGVEERETVGEMITLDKVTWAVNTFGSYKSAGPDGIFPAMLQNIGKSSLLLLVELFRVCVLNGYIPRGWREVRVVFIPKAGRTGHSKPKDFRPISLSSFLLKTLERLIDLHLRTKIDAGIVSGAQHAYLKGRSVESALHDVVGYVERGLRNKEYTLAAFLDIEGAFNNLRIEAIRQALVDLGVPLFLVEWITMMLSSRVIHSDWGSERLRKSVTRGTPQGGVLSPLLWLLAVNVVLRRFDRMGQKVVAYADDVVILVSGKFLPTISDIMQGALGELSAWASDKGLGVNPEKTELVLFTRRYKVENFRLPVLGGLELRLSDCAKYLGVFLDSKLSWGRNTQERLKRGLNAYYACRSSIGRSWGLRPSVVGWLYTSVVRPILTYGCCVWWESLRLASRRNLLSKAQRCASIGMTGAMRSTPQAALDVILHLLPIEQYVMGMAARSLLRLRELGLMGNVTQGHARILGEIEAGGYCLGLPGSTDYVSTRVDFGRVPEVIMPTRESWSGRSRLFDGFAIFTDGSKMRGTGAGVYIEDLNIRMSYRLPDDCSVFQAEVLGVLRAVGLMRDNIDRGSEVTVYVDSQAALMAVRGCYVKSRLVDDCRRALGGALGEYALRLCWVPGHSNIIGNEVADELARQGSEMDDPDRVEAVRPPIGFLFGRITEWILDATNRAWGSRMDCRVSRTLWPVLRRSDSKSLLGKSRVCVRTLIGIITGHCMIGRMAVRMGSDLSDVCGLCEDPEELETVEHILCHCPRLQNSRLRWLGSRFLGELGDVSGCGLEGLIGFVMGMTWLRERRRGAVRV